MKKEFTDEQLSEQISKYSGQAEKLLEDEDRIEQFLQRLELKLQRIPKVGKDLSYVPTLVSLVRSYAKKDYPGIPLESVIVIVSALLYVLSPFDLFPDPLPVVGLLDDGAVLLYALKFVKDDVAKYISWQEQNGKRAVEN